MEEIMGLSEQRAGIWRVSLEQIEATVADHLGPGRVPGNQPGSCFSRQVAMYLGKNVAGWSTTRIGRFYNGRHHTTVLHAIAKIERLRQADETIDALIEVLTAALSPSMERRLTQRFERGWNTALIDAVAARVLEQISATAAE
jgi:chromosomal replication initiation ATPase DnaA